MTFSELGVDKSGERSSAPSEAIVGARPEVASPFPAAACSLARRFCPGGPADNSQQAAESG